MNHTKQKWQSGHRGELKPPCKARIQGTKEPRQDIRLNVCKRMMLLSSQGGNALLSRGAAARSSDEASVMEVERRGIVCVGKHVTNLSRKP